MKKSSIFLLVLSFSLMLFLSVGYNRQVADRVATVSATVGNRELPIYCVDTDEKKIALTFDAAWGDA